MVKFKQRYIFNIFFSAFFYNVNLFTSILTEWGTVIDSKNYTASKPYIFF